MGNISAKKYQPVHTCQSYSKPGGTFLRHCDGVVLKALALTRRCAFSLKVRVLQV